MPTIDRRSFLETSCLTASIGLLASSGQLVPAAETEAPVQAHPPLKRTYRAAVIGSTGHGDFGHGIDVALVDLPGIEFVAIADDDPSGLQAAGERCRVDRLYSDYRQMLEREQIDLVAIATRHPDRHEELVLHCAQTGKFIYSEKPLATDLASFDRMVAACEKGKVKLAVALPNRASPVVEKALALVRDGRIGKLHSLRAQGKCDHRAGGEDLMVLGYHVLDLMCLFAGQPQWTFAQVLEAGRDAEKTDAREATEPIGPIVGDCVAAMFGFPDQIHGYFQSYRNTKPNGDRFSLEIHGSEGIIAARSLVDVVWFRGTAFNPAKPHQWKPIQSPAWDALPNKYHWCHQRLMLDVLAAGEENREPLAGIHNTRWTQEMIQSIYIAHLNRTRADLPLPADQRSHPLS